ncbi:MAG: NAD(P)/FAD-dependent oxidoreductase [Propionibacteriales bacterium]|nr:NAD(P)/FAD-dependent oxidoreductase [Propionibacteriales bacterium]
MPDEFDVTVVGGGHNGLVAAAYLAGAGLRTVVLERLDHTGGAAISAPTFPGVDARLSRYSYLVSLLPQQIIDNLGLDLELRSRSVASYTPTLRRGRSTGLLVERTERDTTAESFRLLTGGDGEYAAWRGFYGEIGAVARALFPTLTQPLPSAAQVAGAVGGDVWNWLTQTPLGVELDKRFTDDTVRGVVGTDAVIGTFASLYDEGLVQNRCFLYHLIGNGTGEWRVPVGGMGAVTDALRRAATGAGAVIRTAARVTSIAADGRHAQTTYETPDGVSVVDSRFVLSGVAPAVLDDLLGRAGNTPRPEGAQVKINLLLERLPRWKAGIAAEVAFAGTLHVAEDFSQLESAYDAASAGRVPEPMPGEFYCHSLADASILGADLATRGYQTLTYFGVHTPARLFDRRGGDVVQTVVDNAFAALDQHLEEPLGDCLAVDGDGSPCIEVKTPQDVEAALNMPGGHIFHGDLQWPWLDGDADPESAAERWGVATGVPNVLVCGSGARRGGAVSGIGGHNAAMAVLDSRSS